MRSLHQQNMQRVKHKRVLPHHQQTRDKLFFLYLMFHFVRIACNSDTKMKSLKVRNAFLN